MIEKILGLIKKIPVNYIFYVAMIIYVCLGGGYFYYIFPTMITKDSMVGGILDLLFSNMAVSFLIDACLLCFLIRILNQKSFMIYVSCTMIVFIVVNLLMCVSKNYNLRMDVLSTVIFTTPFAIMNQIVLGVLILILFPFYKSTSMTSKMFVLGMIVSFVIIPIVYSVLFFTMAHSHYH